MLHSFQMRGSNRDETSVKAYGSKRIGTLLPRSGYDFGDGMVVQQTNTRRANAQLAPERQAAQVQQTAPVTQQTVVASRGKAMKVRLAPGAIAPTVGSRHLVADQPVIRMPVTNAHRQIGPALAPAPAPFRGEIKPNRKALLKAQEARMVGGRLVPMARSGADVGFDPVNGEDRMGNEVTAALNRSEVRPVYGGMAPDDRLRTLLRAKGPDRMISRAQMRHPGLRGLGAVESYCAARANVERVIRDTGVTWADDAGFRRQLAFWLGDFPAGITIRYEGDSICFDSETTGLVTQVQSVIESLAPSATGGGDKEGGTVSPRTEEAIRTATSNVARGVVSSAVMLGVGAIAVVGGLWWIFGRDGELGSASLWRVVGYDKHGDVVSRSEPMSYDKAEALHDRHSDLHAGYEWKLERA